MKYLNGKCYVEVKDEIFIIQPTEIFILKLREKSNSLRIQYQVLNKFQVRKNQKVIRSKSDESVVETYHKKKQPIIQQPKNKPQNCPSCKRNNWVQFDKRYNCPTTECEFNINKEKDQI